MPRDICETIMWNKVNVNYDAAQTLSEKLNRISKMRNKIKVKRELTSSYLVKYVSCGRLP